MGTKIWHEIIESLSVDIILGWILWVLDHENLLALNRTTPFGIILQPQQSHYGSKPEAIENTIYTTRHS